MAAQVIYPTDGQFSMVSKETTPGTPTTPTATVPVDTFVWEDKPVFIDDKAPRGVMGDDAFGVYQGVEYCDVSAIGGPVYPDTIPWLLGNLMGDITTTGTAAPFQHVISLLNPTSGLPSAQPTAHTWTHYYGPTTTSGARQVPSLCLSQVVLTWEAATGLLMWSGKGQGWKSVPAGSRPTNAPSAILAFPAWEGQLAVGGVVPGAAVNNLEKATITITRGLTNKFTGNGVQNPLVIGRTGFSVAFAFQFIAQDETYYNYMMNNTQPQVQALFTQGASSALTSVQLDMQQAAFTKSPPLASNGFWSWNTSGKGVFNTTNVGASGGRAPIQATVKNAVASGTYL
jgi:hypothetical protein